jgi:HK97 family phage prohead protease
LTESIHVRRLQGLKDRTAARIIARAQREGLTVAELAEVRLPWYAIRDQAESDDEPATVWIYDEVGGSFGVEAEQFARDLDEITAREILVRVNSPGGSVFDGIAIYNSLRQHPARIVVSVDSLAANIASVIAMAGDEVRMHPGSQMMIHDALGVERGQAADMAKMSTFLDRQSDNIAGIYRRKAGGTTADWRELMLAETWAFADEAVQLGLADVVVDDGPAPDAELEERMAVRHDLRDFRHAGRRAAPAPRRQAAPRAEHKRTEGAMPVMARASSDAERRQAAAARTEAAGDRSGRVTRRAAPVGVGASRMAGFPARMRAELVEHNGQRRYHLQGHASVVEQPYEMWDSYGPYMEVIERGAFTQTLADEPDVAFLVNHRGLTMARTVPAPGLQPTLHLEMDDAGLKVDAWVNPKRQDVSDLVTAIEDRDVNEMSFAFLLADGAGRWSEDFSEFRIAEVDIDRGDVSAVNYGANPYTDVSARSREVLADLDHLPAGAARAAVARLQARADVTGTAVADVAAKVDPPAPEQPRGRSIAHIEALIES